MTDSLFETKAAPRWPGLLLLALLQLAGVLGHAAAAAERPLAWRVAVPGGTVFLVGSLHFGTTDLYPLASVVEQAYRRSDALVVEVNIHDLDPLRVAEVMAEKGMYSGDATLEDVLGPTVWRSLRDAAVSYGVPVAVYQRQRPWLVAMGLTTLELSRIGYSEDFGIDQYFLRRAKGEKPILELESFERQMDVFAQLPSDLQEQMLIETLQTLGQSREYFSAVVEAWRAGDGEKLGELVSKSLPAIQGSQQLQQVLFTDRNIAMANRVEELIAQGKTYFVVVGAGHLVGQDSVVQLLRDRGYSPARL